MSITPELSKEPQIKWAKSRLDRWKQPPKATNTLNIATFQLRTYPNPCQIHLASGDISSLSNKSGPAFDVIVNSENDHMQMARIYEGERLSAVLRRKGALMDGSHLEDDTVQRELDIQVVYNKKYRRPIEERSVIPTYAGHPDSNLAQQTGARYIFHTTTVGVDGLTTTSDQVTPLVDRKERMEEAVHNVLKKVIEVDKAHGKIFPDNLFEGDTSRTDGGLHLFDKESAQWVRMNADRDSYTPIKSIIFPLFNAGHAGLNVADVITWMVQAFQTFPDTKANHAELLKVTDIYLCAFAQEHIVLVQNAMKTILG